MTHILKKKEVLTMKKLLTLLCSLLLVTIAAGCGSPPQNPNAGKTLRVGTSANFPPYEYIQKSSNSFTGFDIDLANALAKEMGYDKVEFTDMKFNDLPKAIADKKVDILISAISITEKRKGYLDFTEPYLNASIKIVVPTDTKLDTQSLTSVAGLKVAVEEGTTAWHEAKRQNAREIVICKSTIEALELAVAGKADAVLADKLTASFFATHDLRSRISFANDIEYSPSPCAICVRKGDEKMLQQLNRALSQYRRSSDFKLLCRTYFGDENIIQKNN